MARDRDQIDSFRPVNEMTLEFGGDFPAAGSGLSRENR